MSADLTYYILVVNDYTPDIWTEQSIKWLQDYIDACCRYWNKTFREEYSIDISIYGKMYCNPNTIFPKKSLSGLDYYTLETILDWTETTFKNYYDGLVLLSQHKAYYQVGLPSDKEYTGMADNSTLDGWAYIPFEPPMSIEHVIYRYLVPLSHEWLHLVLYDIKLNTSMIDYPPYRTVHDYTTVMFEDKYPMQTLEKVVI